MKKYTGFKLFVLLVLSVQPVFAVTPIETEFIKFFNVDSYYPLTRAKNVSITYIGGSGADIAMQIEIKFNLKAVEKVLVLKVPESGYNHEGVLNKTCRDEPVFVAGYTFDPDINVSELGLRMRSRCGQRQNRILVWVRTSNNEYYVGTLTFHEYASEGGSY